MKKLTATGASTVVSCGNGDSDEAGETIKTSDLNELFKSVEGDMKVTFTNEKWEIEESPSLVGVPIPYYVLSLWPKFEEANKLNSTREISNVNAWKQMQNLINNNKSNWESYVKDWIDDRKYSYESDGEKSTIEILNYNKAIKKNFKNALDTLLDDEVILIYESNSEANKETIKIYSDNKSKYTTEYTYAFDL